jgi:uncharacterized protein (TIGR03437 family)
MRYKSRVVFLAVLLASAATAQVTSVSPAVPGSLATIFGSGLAASLSSGNTIPLSTSLADVRSVTFNGIPAGVTFVSDSQIRVQVPWEVTPGTATVVVNRGTQAMSMDVQVISLAPSVFGLNFGTPQALAVNGDNTLVAAAGSIPGMTAHGANPGDTISLFANGLGAVDMQVKDGFASADATRNVTNTVTVLIGGVPAQVMFAGLSPQFVGVYQIDLVVPGGVPTGPTVPVQLQVADVLSTDPATIAIGN